MLDRFLIRAQRRGHFGRDSIPAVGWLLQGLCDHVDQSLPGLASSCQCLLLLLLLTSSLLTTLLALAAGAKTDMEKGPTILQNCIRGAFWLAAFWPN